MYTELNYLAEIVVHGVLLCVYQQQVNIGLVFSELTRKHPRNPGETDPHLCVRFFSDVCQRLLVEVGIVTNECSGYSTIMVGHLARKIAL